MSDMNLTPGQAEMVRQLFLDGPTADGNVVSKTARKEIVEAGLAVHHRGFAQLTPFGLSVAIERGWPAEKEIRHRDRNQQFRQVSDDSGHDFVIPVERADDWDAFVEQLGSDEAHFETPDFAFRVEGGLTFTWPVEDGVAIIHEINKQLH